MFVVLFSSACPPSVFPRFVVASLWFMKTGTGAALGAVAQGGGAADPARRTAVQEQGADAAAGFRPFPKPYRQQGTLVPSGHCGRLYCAVRLKHT